MNVIVLVTIGLYHLVSYLSAKITALLFDRNSQNSDKTFPRQFKHDMALPVFL